MRNLCIAMTLTSLYHAVSHSMIRVPDIALKGLMDSRGDIVEEIAVGEEEMVYVSVSKNVKESESTLKWAVRNFHGKKLCILHVHQPSKKKPSSKQISSIIYKYCYLFLQFR